MKLFTVTTKLQNLTKSGWRPRTSPGLVRLGKVCKRPKQLDDVIVVCMRVIAHQKSYFLATF